MLLSKITTDPRRFQLRDTPFSESTVQAILAEGIDVAKFDPIPLLDLGRQANGKRYVVAGDGHSRVEAIERMLAQGVETATNRGIKGMPSAWRRGTDWDIPCRIVTDEEARVLSWTANLSRSDFTPGEEAKVFQSMLDAGIELEQVARLAHRCPAHVTRILSLNSLCRDIRVSVGASPAAGGIDVLTGQVLASGFKRFGVEPAQQQQLWHCVLKSAMLNFQSAKKFIDRIGSRLGEKSDEGFLFQIPANAVAVVAEAKTRGQAARTAKTGLGLLLSAMKAGGLEDFPELVDWLTTNGERVVTELASRVTEDAEVLANLVAPSKVFKPRPAAACDARIARQYDPEATPMLMCA